MKTLAEYLAQAYEEGCKAHDNPKDKKSAKRCKKCGKKVGKKKDSSKTGYCKCG